MPFLSRDVLTSIRFKVLATLFVLLAFSITISMFGIWRYERERYVEIGREEAMRAAKTVEKALRASMLRNDREAIRLAVEDIYSIVRPSNISIIANDGLVAFSSDRPTVGARVNRLDEPSCAVCHVRAGVVPQQDAIFITKHGQPVLRNIIKIPNEPACYGCHPASQRNCGILLYDVSFAGIYDMLRTVALRTFLTGLATFLLVVVVISLVFERLVHQPLQRLLEGFIRVGRGDFSHWVETGTQGELQDMADHFNIMSRAIGRYVNEIGAKNKEIGTLYSFVREMSRTIEWPRVKRLVVDLLFETFHLRHAILVVPLAGKAGCYEISRRAQGDRRYLRDELCLDTPDLPLPAGVHQDVVRWQEGGIREAVSLDNGARVLIPLFSEGSDIGLLCLQKEEGEQLTASEQKLLAAIADHVAISFANSRLYNMAVTDGLTGLYNKRYFQGKLAELIGLVQQGSGKGFGLLMVDIDHFKPVNDTHGHPAGDAVLQQLGRLFKKNLRYDEISCRFGGEEFAILLPGQEEGDAWATASRLREAVEEHTFVSSNCPPIRLTVSVGIACYPMDATSADDLVRAADAALYTAKREGRNRVSAWSGAHGAEGVAGQKPPPSPPAAPAA